MVIIMKNKINQVFLRQCGTLLLHHLIITAVITLFGLAAFWWFLEQPIWKEIFSAVCTLLYFGMMMSAAQRIADRDGKGWTQQSPYAAKGFLLSLSVVGTTFVLWLLYVFTWSCLTLDGSVYGLAGTFYNIVFTVWTFPFNGIIRLYQGGLMWYGHFLLYLPTVFSVTLGYWFGYKKIRLSDRLEPLMYEKENNDD